MDDHGNPRPASRVDLDDPATYLRIKRIASRFVRPQLNPTLNATAFAAEVWIKLKGSRSALRVRDETHLDALVGQAARYVANSWARGRLSLKRRGIRVTDADLDRQTAREVSLDTVLQMNESLAELEKENAKTAAILERRLFRGADGGGDLGESRDLRADGGADPYPGPSLDTRLAHPEPR